MMLKKLSYGLIGLFGICVLAFGVLYFLFLSKGYEGFWYGGVVKDGKFISRASFHFEKNSDGQIIGRYNVIDYGKYDKPFENLKINGRDLYCEMESEALLLHLNWKGDHLTGVVRVKNKESALDFKRGMNFFVPRVGDNGLAETNYTYEPPQKLSDGWEVGDLRSDKGDITPVENAVKRILNMELSNVHSLVVVKKGKLVLDEYFYGYGPDDEHQLRSVTKSILSALFGLESDRGWLKTTDKLYDYFPEYRTKPDWDKKKNKITLGMVLSMTSGFESVDEAPGIKPYSDVLNMFTSPDWLWYCLTQKLAYTPGKHWAYSSEDLQPLGEIIARKSGMSLPDFAQKYLYDPLGIHAHNWYVGPNGVVDVEGSHWLRPRDMAKIGYLYLQKGKWNGQQILSEKWVEESTSIQAHPPANYGGWSYGYLWWPITNIEFGGKTLKAFTASGRGGQYILVIPELELVMVVTAGNYDGHGDSLDIWNFLKSDVLKAVE